MKSDKEADHRSFSAALEAERPRLLRYALKLSGGRVHDSEDLVQESFVIALANKGRSRANSLGPWLRKIVLNLVRNKYRIATARATQTAPAEDLDRYRAPGEEVGLRHEYWSEVRECLSDEVAAALECIPPCYAQAVVLRGVYRYSTNEIVKLLKVPRSTINSRISRGRLMLRELLVDRSHATA